jgi:hypothetical protein
MGYGLCLFCKTTRLHFNDGSKDMSERLLIRETSQLEVFGNADCLVAG